MNPSGSTHSIKAVRCRECRSYNQMSYEYWKNTHCKAVHKTVRHPGYTEVDPRSNNQMSYEYLNNSQGNTVHRTVRHPGYTEIYADSITYGTVDPTAPPPSYTDVAAGSIHPTAPLPSDTEIPTGSVTKFLSAKQGKIMENIDTGTCSLCLEVYTNICRPRVLPCGHSYCTDCLQKMIVNGTLCCPTCKSFYFYPNVNGIAVNFEYERCLSAFADFKACTSKKPTFAMKKTKRKTLLDEQRANAQDKQNAIETWKTQLHDYDKFLIDSVKEHKDYAQKLNALASKHESLADEMEEERKKVGEHQSKAESYSEELQNNMEALDNAYRCETQDDIYLSIGRLVEQLWNIDQWIESRHQLFPDPKITSSRKVLLQPVGSLSNLELQESTQDAEVPAHLAEDLTILENIDVHLENKFHFADISSRLWESAWRQRLSSGKIVAVDSSLDRQRFAKLSAKEDKIYLHCLQNELEHPSTIRLEHSEVIDCLDKSSTVAFLDLSWDGSYQGRVHILLSPDTPLARQFRILCTGDLGYTYAHTKLFKRENVDNRSVYMSGGDYQCNKGSCSIALNEEIDPFDLVYRRNEDAGIVMCHHDNVAQFSILTSSGSNSQANFVFGKIHDGFLLLQDAVKQLSDVIITDCGVVLPV